MNIANIDNTDTEQSERSSAVEFNSKKSRNILKLTHNAAREYFLKSESYCNFDLPHYFNFTPLLLPVVQALDLKKFEDYRQGNPTKCENVNYKVLNNKDGKYAWRPLQLIHPALYVSLVNQITCKDNWNLICKRFSLFAENSNIKCISIPRESQTRDSDKAAQVSHWWQEIEQASLEMALDYEYLIRTDITDCYGAIYTHSIAWALHGKERSKENKNDKKLLGNNIDSCIRDMSHGQTNGIPQGSALMDFIAEMVLGYADHLLSEEISKHLTCITDYKILRYRDDYRIFTNNPSDGGQIVKCLTEIMIDLGLKLSAEKTKASNEVVGESIKSDKFYWMRQKQGAGSLQKNLLIIHELAKQYPNSGSLTIALNNFLDQLQKAGKPKESIISFISISVDIAHKNPRTYPHMATIVSWFLQHAVDKNEKSHILRKIVKKFQDIPNTAHLSIWLQRAALGILDDLNFEEPICQLAAQKDADLWDSSWLKEELRNQIIASSIIDNNILENLSAVISKKEIELFNRDGYNGY